MTDPRTVATTVAGEPCRVTSPLLRQDTRPVYICAPDATLTAADPDGREVSFCVACEDEWQFRYIATEMAKRDDLGPWRQYLYSAPGEDGATCRIIPFRLLPRRWLADWRETADRIEVREGASGSVYMRVIVGRVVLAEKRVPMNRRCDVDQIIASGRAANPSLSLFDFRPQRGEG